MYVSKYVGKYIVDIYLLCMIKFVHIVCGQCYYLVVNL